MRVPSRLGMVAGMVTSATGNGQDTAGKESQTR
jgi:hypothetical protein